MTAIVERRESRRVPFSFGKSIKSAERFPARNCDRLPFPGLESAISLPGLCERPGAILNFKNSPSFYLFSRAKDGINKGLNVWNERKKRVFNHFPSTEEQTFICLGCDESLNDRRKNIQAFFTHLSQLILEKGSIQAYLAKNGTNRWMLKTPVE